MNQIVHTIKQFNKNDGSKISATNFSELTQQAIWGTRLNTSSHVVATHHELAMLRQCASKAAQTPNHVIHVISSRNQQRINYVVRTLMHFGISCGKIIVSGISEADDNPNGVWIFVEELAQAS
jgi:hypothetical protein